MKLTVGDLKKLIEGQPDDAEVLLQAPDGCCGDTFDLDYSDSRSSLEDYDKKPGYVVITVGQIPGFRSCIQAGGSKRADELYWRRNKSYAEMVMAGHQENLQQHIKEYHDAYENHRTRLTKAEWLGFTEEEWKLYLDSSVSLASILKAKKNAAAEKPAEDAVKDVLRSFGLFRMRLRSALGRAGVATNPGWTEQDIAQAVEKLAEKQLVEAPPINTLKLGYLRKQAKEYRAMSASLAKEAAKEGDHEKWDMSRLSMGQAWAFEQMIGYTRGFNHKQFSAALRKGKL